MKNKSMSTNNTTSSKDKHKRKSHSTSTSTDIQANLKDLVIESSYDSQSERKRSFSIPSYKNLFTSVEDPFEKRIVEDQVGDF